MSAVAEPVEAKTVEKTSPEAKTVEKPSAEVKTSPEAKAEEKPSVEVKTSPEAKAEEKPSAEEPKTAAAPARKEEDVVKEAMGLLAAGKRNLLVKDTAAAVDSFALCCRLLGEQYGETASECGEAFYFYGIALLEMARMENGVLENVLDGVPEGEDAECSNVEDPDKCTDAEKEELSEKVGEAIVYNTVLLEKGKQEHDAKAKESIGEKSKNEPKELKTNGVGAVKEEKKTNGVEAMKTNGVEKTNGVKKDESSENSATEEEEEKEGEEADANDDALASAEGEDEEGEEGDGQEGGENESIASNDAGPSDVKEGEDKSAVEAEDEDDPSSLQLSWEMLELAKKCLKKKADSMPLDDEKRMEVEARLSQTYMHLGEVSIESENYPQAVEDLTSCLRRRQELLPDDSRCIAETHYQMGVALGFNLQFDEGVGHLEDAIAVLEKRIKNLEDKKESKDPTKKEDAFYTRVKEIEEIGGLIPEIREKITDTRDMQEETHKKLGDRVLAEEKEMEAITAAKSPSKNGNVAAKSANGFGKSSDKNGGPTGDAQLNGSSGNASDISHMMKKRKKSEETATAVDPKKAKADSNGQTEKSTGKA